MGPIRPWLRAKRAAEWQADANVFLAKMRYLQRWYGYPPVVGDARPKVTQAHLDACIKALGPRPTEDPGPFTVTVEKWQPPVSDAPLRDDMRKSFTAQQQAWGELEAAVDWRRKR